MVVRELLTMLGFDVDTHGLKKYDEALKDAIKATAALSAAGIAAIGALGFAFFRGAGEIEQVEVALATMLGSMDEAKLLLADITKLAEKTPFELMGLVRSSKQLLAFGIEGDKVIETMTNLGNISAGIGMNKLPTIVRAFGKIRAKGRASMEELNMMLEAGVPILDEIAKKLDMEVGPALFRMVEKGVVSFDIVNQTIKEMSTGTGKFANLMIKQSKTLFGLISNIKDVFTNLVNAIGKDLLPEGKRLAILFLDWISINKELIKIKVADFYLGVLKAVKSVIDLFEKFKVIGNIRDFLRLLKAIITIFGERISNVFLEDGENLIDFLSRWLTINRELITQNIIDFINKAADVFETLLRIIKKTWPWLIAFGAELLLFKGILKGIAIVKYLSNPLYLVIAALTLLVGAWIAAGGDWDTFIKNMKDGWMEFIDLIDETDFYKIFAGIGDRIISFYSEILDTILGTIKFIQEAIDLITFGKKGIDESEKPSGSKRTLGSMVDLGEFLADFATMGALGAFLKLNEKAKSIEENIPLETTPENSKPYQGYIYPPTNVTNTIKVDAVISVPEGTPEAQQNSLQKSADTIFAKTMRNLMNIDGIPGLEAQ